MGVSLWKLLIRLMPIYYQLTPSSDQTLSRFRQAAGQPADDWYAIKHASGRLPGGSRFQVAGGCGGGPAAGSPQRAAAASFFPRRSNEKAPGRRPRRWRRQCKRQSLATARSRRSDLVTPSSRQGHATHAARQPPPSAWIATGPPEAHGPGLGGGQPPPAFRQLRRACQRLFSSSSQQLWRLF